MWGYNLFYEVDIAHVKSYLWAAYNTLAKYVPSEDAE